MPSVLIIDDNPSVRMALEILFSLHDIQTLSADGPEQGLQILARQAVDLVVQDMNFSADTTSGQEGIALFGKIRQLSPDMPVILLTAWTDLEAAVELMKAGAADYLGKPWNDERLMTTVRNLIELGQSNRELNRYRQREQQQRNELASQYDLAGLIWHDSASMQVLEMACRVARSDAAVLITGPNGSGKEKIAELIQRHSAVPDGPFVILNCGALPADLIEAELFGAEAGAYTGAAKSRQGKFEAADGGTLFLDEIGNLPLSGQMKLLRVLETGRFQRLGSNREQQVRVRILSATNADLPAMIRSGEFRQDLYYRLNVLQIDLPGLADRPGDILPLARHFLGPQHILSGSAERALLQHGWPGNVRELSNLMQRARLLARQPVIEAAELGLLPVPKADLQNEGGPDRQAIEQALAAAAGVVSQAAASLGLSRQALYRRMQRFGIER